MIQFSLLPSLLLLNSILKTESFIAELKTLKKNIEVEPGTHILGSAVHETSVLYVTCWNLNENTRRSCNLTTNTLGDGSFPRVCKIPIEIERNHTLDIFPRVFSFEEGQSIMVWLEVNRADGSLFLRMFFHASLGCRIKTDTISLGADNSKRKDILDNVLIKKRSNNYEIIYDDEKTCQGSCYMIFSKNGERLYEAAKLERPDNRSGKIKFSARIGIERFGTGHCFVMTSEEPLGSDLFVNQRVRQLLDSEKDRVHSLRFSTTHSKFSVCIQNTRESKVLNCTQNDHRTWFNLTFNTNFGDPIIYNTAENGFLVLNSRKVRSEKETDDFKIFLTLFDSQRRLRFSVELFTFKCQNRPIYIRAQIWENEAKEYCTSLFKQAELPHFSIACLPKIMTSPQNSWIASVTP